MFAPLDAQGGRVIGQRIAAIGRSGSGSSSIPFDTAVTADLAMHLILHSYGTHETTPLYHCSPVIPRRALLRMARRQGRGQR
jgi:hypothetical protein